MKQLAWAVARRVVLFFAKGEVIMWGYTVSMIALSWYAVVNGKVIDGSVAAMYIGALGSFVGGKKFDRYQQARGGVSQSAPDTDQGML